MRERAFSEGGHGHSRGKGQVAGGPGEAGAEGGRGAAWRPTGAGAGGAPCTRQVISGTRLGGNVKKVRRDMAPFIERRMRVL